MNTQNITCPKCHHRHPPNKTCEEMKALADEASNKRRTYQVGAAFVEDMGERWIVIECRDALEKGRLMETLRLSVSWSRFTGSDRSPCVRCGTPYRDHSPDNHYCPVSAA